MHLLFVNRKLAHFLLQLRQFLGLVTFAASASVGSCRSAVSSWLRATLSKPYSIASAAVPLPNGEVRFPPHTVSPVTRVHSAIGSHPRIISADQSPCGPFQRGASLSRPTHVKNVRITTSARFLLTGTTVTIMRAICAASAGEPVNIAIEATNNLDIFSRRILCSLAFFQERYSLVGDLLAGGRFLPKPIALLKS